MGKKYHGGDGLERSQMLQGNFKAVLYEIYIWFAYFCIIIVIISKILSTTTMKMTLKEYLKTLNKSKLVKLSEHSISAEKEQKLFDFKQSCQMVLPEEEEDDQQFKIKSMLIQKRDDESSCDNSPGHSPKGNFRLKSSERAAFSQIFDRKKRQTTIYEDSLRQSQVVSDTKQFITHIHEYSELKQKQRRSQRINISERVRKTALKNNNTNQDQYFQKYEALKANLRIK